MRTGWDVLVASVPALCDWKRVCVCASLQTSIGPKMLWLNPQSASCTLSPPGPALAGWHCDPGRCGRPGDPDFLLP